MDFWSRLIGGGGLPATKEVNVNSPQQRLGRFKRATDHLLQVWRKSKTRPTDPATAENVRTCIESLTRILHDESHASIPHLCIEYAASAQIYISATEIALSTLDEGIIHALLALLNKLVDSEGGNFLDNRAFAGSVTTFAKEVIAHSLINSDIGASLFEVLFSIAAKLRLQPEDIRFWFKRGAQGPEEVSEDPAASQSKPNDVAGDFPLFYVLLDHVHHDGKVGEFARTGLLYIIESSARSEWLEKWVVESDLATLMASGLGALYSQLSRKLVASYGKDTAPPIIAYSDETPTPSTFDAVETSSQEFRDGLITFLKYLEFWQDILENCTSDDVKQTLLEHFEFLFLKQLLYPSLLESSDADGGFVAVLTYLRCILLTVNHAELTHRILHYLLAIPKKPANGSSSSRPATLARRHKSETLVRKQALRPEEFSPGLYTLVDMILGGLKSHSQQTTATTLRLLDTILSRQHQYCVPGLIKAKILQPEDMKRSILAHDRNVEMLLSMAEDLIEEETDLSYDSHLQDARVLLEDHVCSTNLLSLPSLGAVLDQENFPKRQLDWPNPLEGHKIDPADPLLQSMLCLLDHFFSNNIETNLSLTQAFSSLASCGHLNLEGWLLDGCAKRTNPRRDSAASPVIPGDALKSNEIQPDNNKMSDTSHTEGPTFTDRTVSTSPILQSLDHLIAQVDHFRQEIEDFGVYLLERKQVFKVGEEIESVTKDAPTSPSPARGSKAIPPNRARASGQISSISERLHSNNNSASVSRTNSPRGRQHSTPSAPALVGRLSHLRISPSPSPSKDSSIHTASPLRRDSFSSNPSKNTGDPIGPAKVLRQKIKIPWSISKRRNHSLDIGSSETSSTRSESIEPGSDQRQKVVEVSLSKILTNVLILHEFLLELAAIVEVRASLFGEVSFD